MIILSQNWGAISYFPPKNSEPEVFEKFFFFFFKKAEGQGLERWISG